MYSRVPYPANGVHLAMIKPEHRYGGFTCNHLTCKQFGADWFVWDNRTGFVQAIFSCAINIHGWSAAKAHAQSYVMGASTVNPHELDSIP